MFGIPVKTIAIGFIVLFLVAGGAWIMNQRNKVNELTKEKLQTDAAIALYRKQEKNAIEITKQKQAYVKKSEVTDKEVYEEISSKPGYDVLLPESGRVLINRAIDEANGYIHSSD